MRVAGMISGTSHDAVEVAMADFDLDGTTIVLRPVGARSVEFPDALRTRVSALLPPHPTTIAEVCRLDTELGRLFAHAAAEVIAGLGGGCDIVCSHGQTVFHWVQDGRALGTLQLGNPAWIAEATGCAVVSDLRSRDVAVGGQGAPLVAILDALLVLDDGRPRRAALNLGGIANVTLRRDGRVLAWDVGPANALIDAAVVRVSGGAESMDTDGARAARGRVRRDLLQRLLAEPYYAAPPPKSTGKELFHAGYVHHAMDGLPAVTDDDLLATVTELTCLLIADVCRADRIEELVVAGGGTRNPVLMGRLGALAAPTVLRPIEDFGLGAGSKEAYAFALLGYLTTLGLPGAVPSATGAASAPVLGAITPGPRPWRVPDPPPPAPQRLVVRPGPDPDR